MIKQPRQSTVFDRAIAAHAKWKYRLFLAIKTGQSEFRVSDVRPDDRCDFGAWLSSLPDTEKRTERCQQVRALHTEFHKIAAEVLDLALRGKQQEAQAAIGLGSRFADISSQLTLALGAWENQAKPG